MEVVAAVITKFPEVIVTFPAVAVSDVEAVSDPVTEVFPVVFPMFTAPVPPPWPIAIAPEPEVKPIVPLVEVASVIPPEPDFMAVIEVVLVEPNVTFLTAPPVPIERVVAEASVEIPSAPVPELPVHVPLVLVSAKAPDPDCTVVAEVLLVDPKVVVLTAPPVAMVTVVAEASLLMANAPVPEFIVKVPFVDVTAKAPEPL